MWIKLRIYDVAKPNKVEMWCGNTMHISDFYGSVMRDEKDVDVIHRFTVIAIGDGSQRAMRVHESVDDIFKMIAGK